MTKKKEKSIRLLTQPDYDTAWKTVIEENFEGFLDYFFPDIYADIDFSRGIEILSKELPRIIPKGQVGDRKVDVLIKVHLKNGDPKFFCVLIHVEVQGPPIKNFMDRIFVYFYRIFEKYRKKGMEVISLAILTDSDEQYRPNEYFFSRWGFVHTLIIPMIKISDFKTNPVFIKKLETSINPFALVVKVQLKSMEVKNGEVDQRFNFKRELIREFYKHGYDKKYIHSILLFIDLVFPLPEAMEKAVSEEIAKLEEEEEMNQMLSWEKIAKKEGKKEGKIEGKMEALREAAVELLKNGVNIDIIARSIKLSKKELEELAATVH